MAVFGSEANHQLPTTRATQQDCGTYYIKTKNISSGAAVGLHEYPNGYRSRVSVPPVV